MIMAAILDHTWWRLKVSTSLDIVIQFTHSLYLLWNLNYNCNTILVGIEFSFFWNYCIMQKLFYQVSCILMVPELQEKPSAGVTCAPPWESHRRGPSDRWWLTETFIIILPRITLKLPSGQPVIISVSEAEKFIIMGNMLMVIWQTFRYFLEYWLIQKWWLLRHAQR